MLRKGVTLIEMISATIILVIISTIVMANVSHATATARTSALHATIANLQGAVDSFYRQSGNYPTYAGSTIADQPVSGSGCYQIMTSAGDGNSKTFYPDYIRTQPSDYGPNFGLSGPVYYGINGSGLVFATQSSPSTWSTSSPQITADNMGSGFVFNCTPAASTGSTGTTPSGPTTPLQSVSGTAEGGYAVESNGTAWAWGWNKYGELGNGTTTNSFSPTQISNLSNIVAIAGSDYNGYALDSSGNVWAWGSDASFGQLGDNSSNGSLKPVKVSGLSSVIAIAGGGSSGYALKSDGTVWDWGYNNDGQLGNWTTSNSFVPVQVSGLTGVVAIAAGESDGYALKSDGTVWAWGSDGLGQTGGNGNLSPAVTTPVQVPNLSNVIQISNGSYDTAALRSDGTVWTWGPDMVDSSGNFSPNPVQIPGLTNIVNISQGDGWGFALDSSGTLWEWIDNSGSFVVSKFGSYPKGKLLYISYETGFLLKSDGTLWSMGSNGYGQLGNGTATATGSSTFNQISIGSVKTS